MIATLCLYSCVLAPAQLGGRPVAAAPAPPLPRGEWALEPHLNRAQELVYRGTFTEQSSNSRVEFSAAYRVESRVFVLEVASGSTSVAFLTVLKSRDANPRATPTAEPTACSVRLEVARVTGRGKVIANPAQTQVPLQGVPTLECGAFVELPSGKVTTGQSWDVSEPGRPVRVWRVAGVELVNGASCVKLIGTQQSDDWANPRADRTAWWRQDTVWLTPRTGLANRVERRIQRREPAHTRATYESVMRYDLESSLQYNGDYEERAADILQARAFAESAAPLLADPVRSGTQLTALLSRIAYHLDHHLTRTPYREAVLQVKRRVEAARKGEAPPAPLNDESPEVSPGATVGSPAPDFLVPDLVAGNSKRLKNWLGRPVLLVFYSPAAPVAAEVLLFAQRLAQDYPDSLTVLALTVSGKAADARDQHEQLKLNFPLLDGSGLLVSYGVEATPRLVLLDANGTVRATVLGWGDETPGEVLQHVSALGIRH